jgi:hypothetical protein
MFNNDPYLGGSFADKTVKLVFGQWEYRKEIIVTISGNTRGLSVIKSAVGVAYEELPYTTVRGEEFAEIKMVAPNGDTLSVEDDDCQGEEWLSEMLVSAEITALTPETK